MPRPVKGLHVVHCITVIVNNSRVKFTENGNSRSVRCRAAHEQFVVKAVLAQCKVHKLSVHDQSLRSLYKNTEDCRIGAIVFPCGDRRRVDMFLTGKNGYAQ